MKKRIALLIVLQFTLLFNGCSSDSGDAPVVVTPPVAEVINTTIKTYSKDYGSTGETITMTGENFSTKMSEIKITFDGVAATILSATATEIAFTLPATEKLLPKLVITIENRTVTNSVVNKYNGNIGILPIPSTTTWFTIDNGLKSNLDIPRIQMLSDKIIYYTFDNDIYRTLDGGIKWDRWAYNYSGTGAFFATIIDEGWCYTLFHLASNMSGGVDRIPVGGGVNEVPIWREINSSRPGIKSVYVEDNMQKGTIVSQRGDVYTTTNGVDFTKIYDAKLYSATTSINTGVIFQSTEIDNNHIWVIGYKNSLDPDLVNGLMSYTNKPFILYKNNMTDGWKENQFINESNFEAKEICFVDSSTGFLLIRKYTTPDVKLFKTTDGGDTWSPIYNGEKFTKFAFKDGNTGWAILDNKIYKTTNGGVAWTLDYTHDQPIRNIAYKNNVVWAISNDKIIKRYL